MIGISVNFFIKKKAHFVVCNLMFGSYKFTKLTTFGSSKPYF